MPFLAWHIFSVADKSLFSYHYIQGRISLLYRRNEQLPADVWASAIVITAEIRGSLKNVHFYHWYLSVVVSLLVFFFHQSQGGNSPRIGQHATHWRIAARADMVVAASNAPQRHPRANPLRRLSVIAPLLRIQHNKVSQLASLLTTR